jgi:hypothetical protein
MSCAVFAQAGSASAQAFLRAAYPSRQKSLTFNEGTRFDPFSPSQGSKICHH